MNASSGQPPELSIVIPVYNEEGILRSAILDLYDRLSEFHTSFEVILAENGSTDRTRDIAQGLMRRFENLRLLSTPEANYGRALKHGILQASGRFVICDEIDLCDTEFYEAALHLLTSGAAQFVVGSKLVGGARDFRPWMRRRASALYTGLLRGLLSFHGTDTHGPKAFVRAALLSTVTHCQIERDVFASELVIRAHRDRLKIVEVPIRVVEKRPPSINLIRRTPHVLKNLAQLTWSIRFKG